MENRKFIIGRIRLKAGNSAEFMAFARRYVAASRGDDGCLYFDMVPTDADPDEIVFVECFRDEAAHAAHTQTPHFAEGGDVLQRLAESISVENIFAREVKAEALRF